MKSRRCPLMDLHADALAVDKLAGYPPGFAKSSAIRYSPRRLKSHRRLDNAIRREDVDAMKFRNRVVSPSEAACPTC